MKLKTKELVICSIFASLTAILTQSSATYYASICSGFMWFSFR